MWERLKVWFRKWFKNDEVPATTTPAPEQGGILTEAEAKALIADMQFMEGAQKSDPRAILMVRIYGKRITHFGGGNKPTDKVSNETLWKPLSDTTKRLVVITPHNLRVDSVTVGDETLTNFSVGNGFRPTWRFSKPGGAYVANTVLTVNPAGKAIIAKPSVRQTFTLQP